MSTAPILEPTLFESAHLPAPRPVGDRPVAPRPLELGDRASVPHLMHPQKGAVGGVVVAFYGPDGKGKGPRVTLDLHGGKGRATFPQEQVRRDLTPDELVDDWFAEKDPIVVIACGKKKLDTPAPAGDLYTGSQHRLARQAADRLALNLGGRVVILSAKHGLLDLDTVVEPYDTCVTDPGAVTAVDVGRQLIAMDARTIIALTARDYTALLRGRVGVRVDDRLAGTTSIFEQRTRLATIKNGKWVA